MASLNVSTTRTIAFIAAFEIDPLIVYICYDFNLFVCAKLVCVFGIASNVVNIRLFQKQGYENGVNVTLTALAASDIGALTNLLVYIIIYNPLMDAEGLAISQFAVAYVAYFTHEYFIKVSSIITAFAALERCLCVVLPLKIKRMVPTRVTFVVIVTIFGLLSVYLFCNFLPMTLYWSRLPGSNWTQLMFEFNHFRDVLFPTSYYITDVLLQYCTFISLIASATIIFLKLKTKAKWRRSISSSGDGLSKEIKSAKLFMIVSFMCILLLLPQCIWFTVVAFVRELKVDGVYSVINFLVISFTVVLESLNCSMTIFIYYRMSSRYRHEFKKMFACTKVFCFRVRH